MFRKVKPEEADTLLVSHFVNPMNDFTWYEADATKATQKDYREAILSEMADRYPNPGDFETATSYDKMIMQAVELADFGKVMKCLVAMRRVIYPGS